MRLEDLGLSYRAVVEKTSGVGSYLSAFEIMAYFLPRQEIVIFAVLATIAVASGVYNSLMKRHKTLFGVFLGAVGIPGILISIMVGVVKYTAQGG